MGYQADSEKVPIGTDHEESDVLELKHFIWTASANGSSDDPLKEVISGCFTLFCQVHGHVSKSSVHIDKHMTWENKDDLRNYQENHYSLDITAEECPAVTKEDPKDGYHPAYTKYWVKAYDEDNISSNENPTHRFSALIRITPLH